VNPGSSIEVPHDRLGRARWLASALRALQARSLASAL